MHTLIALCVVVSFTTAQTFTPKYTSAINSNINGYYEYLPAGYNLPENANKKYPVIFYFHGGTQVGYNNGNNLEALKAAGIPQVIYQGKMPTYFTSGTDTFSYIIICPQAKNEYLDTEANAVISYILNQPSVYRINVNKVYLTGFSWGGRATWRVMMSSITNALKIAAAIPIGHYCSPTPDLNTLRYPAEAGIAVWALHNTNDEKASATTCATNYINKFNSYNPSIPAKATISCIPSSSQCKHLDTTQNYIYNPTLYKLPGTGMSVYEWFYQFSQPGAGTAPVARAGNDQSISFPTKQVTLNGSGSTDADGSISYYSWRKISGPSSFNIVSPQSATTVVNNLVAGIYNFELKVIDNQNLMSFDTVSVTVTNPNPNIPPVANAGRDSLVLFPVSGYNLNGAASSDTDGSIEAYNWQLVSGPAGSSFSSNTIVNPVVNNLKPGTYIFSLTVTDNQGATNTDQVQLIVKNTQANKPPQAMAGSDVVIVLPINSVTLSGSLSSDVDGTITAYHWNKISGPQNYQIASPESTAAVINNLTAGTYSFELIVTDDSLAIGKDTVSVIVSTQERVLIDIGPTLTNSPDATGKYWNNMTDGRAGVRVANAKTITNSPTTLNLEVVNRIDGTYNTSANGLNSTNTTAAVGEYPATVTKDFAFASPTTTTGSWKITGLDATKQYTIKFWGTRSDTYARIIQIKRADETTWQEYDCSYNVDYNRSAIFTFSGKTEMPFDIRVKSGSQFGYICVIDITIISATPPSNQAPVARAGSDRIIVLPKDSVNLNGALSSDPESSTLKYKWTKISGGAAQISNDSISSPSVMGMVQGTYQFELRVTDPQGLFGLDTLTITVNPAPLVPAYANAGADQVITHPADSVVLNGSNSSTQSGSSIVSYAWTRIAGPAIFELSQTNTAIVTARNLKVGTYLFELTIVNSAGTTSKDTVAITVNIMPTPPPVNTDLLSCGKALTLVVIGSSTSYGYGATPVDSSWVNKFTTYIKSKNSQHKLINLSATGYTTYKSLCPTGFVPPANRPSPDTLRNITKALSYNPDAIIINLPTNDIGSGYTNDEQIANYERAMTLANAANVPVWVTTTQPRSDFTLADLARLKTMRDWTYERFGTRAIDFWSTVADSAGRIVNVYNYDSTHVNNYGHHLFYTRVVGERILDHVCYKTNLPPVAKAGNDTTITLPQNVVNLNGSLSYDDDGTIISWLWTKISGPAQYSFTDSTISQPLMSNLVAGVYSIELAVKDDSLVITKDTISITVNPEPPVAQRILIDIGPTLTNSPDATGKYWNNMTDARAGVRVANAKTTTNVTTTLNLEVVNRIDGTYNTSANGLNSTNSTAAVGEYPITVTRDYAFASPTTTTGSWKFTGLDSTKQYRIKFWGSRSDTYARILQIKRSDETIWQEYDGSYNVDYNKAAVFTFSGKKEMSFDIRVKTGSQFGYINVIDIDISQPAAARGYNPYAVVTETEESSAGKTNIHFYPNPVKNNLTLQYRNNARGAVSIRILNANMQTIKNTSFTKTSAMFNESVDITSLAKGLYFVEITMANERILKRMVKL